MESDRFRMQADARRGSFGTWGAAAAAIAVLTIALGCAGRIPSARLPGDTAGAAAEMKQLCPPAVSATVRIRLSPATGPGATIDGTLKFVHPDTLALTGRLGVFHPFFALRADADSAELLLHDLRRYWISARADEDWTVLNPSAWARALSWALCPGDLLDRLEGVERAAGEPRTVLLRGRLRGTRYVADLTIEERTARLRGLRIVEDGALVMELRQRDFRRSGSAVIPSVMEIRIPAQDMTVKVEVLSVTTSRPGSPLEVGRVRPPAWSPAAPGEAIFPMPGRADDPG